VKPFRAATPFAAWLLAWLSAYLLVATASAENGGHPATPLPRIVIAPGGTRFVTDQGKPFVPFGVTYYRPGTGWAPQVWKRFEAEATRKDFLRMKELGVNCVRVFLTYHSLCRQVGVLEPSGLAKFDEFLHLAEEAGIYVHPAGPDHWEGPPEWKPVAIEDETTVQALETFWQLFATRYRERPVIFAYDLRNEPELGWDSPSLRRKWNVWLQTKYGKASTLKDAWGETNSLAFGSIPPPSDKDNLKNRSLLDYQTFREETADEWTRRQAQAIKKADPKALVTVGLIQWSVPVLLPGTVRHYSAFRPERQAKFLDFLEIHFYPLASGAYEYRSAEEEQVNLAYLESLVREVALAGKPVVLAEFGWYGGGKPKFDGGKHPAATQEQQAQYCRKVVETSAGLACGWLNWGLYDQPEATDCSELTGLLTAQGETKAWGKAFQELASKYCLAGVPAGPEVNRPVLDWEAAVTSIDYGREFRRAWLKPPVGEPEKPH
jgi:hypothetical protein